MNFLAHIYLSGSNDQVKTGNFIGDWVKGNAYKKFPEDIQKGILMHRFIDSFTDTHPTVKQSISRFHSKYHKYSGIIVDILYDHYLAIDWNKYSDVSIRQFSSQLNCGLKLNMEYFSPEVREFFPKFIKNRWMESYVSLDGIRKVLQGMSKHTSLPDKAVDALQIIVKDYEPLKKEFNDFFPLLINEVEANFDVTVRVK
jgi:acyl carrier protein phosphodiesterase